MSFSAPRRRPLEWIDRNPTEQPLYYNASGIAPHTSTIRASYIVPTGRKALLTFLRAQVLRDSAAGTLGRVELRIVTSGEYIRLIHFNNNVGDTQHSTTGTNIILDEGTQIRIMTEDNGVLGAMSYRACAELDEFDKH